METAEMRSTVQFSEISWNGDGFDEEQPDRLWRRMPQSLKNIALAERGAGNKVESILENKARGIVLLAFQSSPRISFVGDSEVRIHETHRYGNYCYDGTKCTYEDSKSGCFLAFNDPEYVEDAF